jgi:hypothetical protein
MHQNKSEIARILEQIDQEYQASKIGLQGLASGSTRHDFIQAKSEHIGKCHEQLVELIGAEEAISIIANTIWSSADQGKPSEPSTASHREGGAFS